MFPAILAQVSPAIACLACGEGGPRSAWWKGRNELDQLYYRAKLYDFYGGLLTGKQRECLHLHIAEDFSLAEIGEELGITRQAAHDNIRRAERALAEMEETLGLFARQQEQERAIAVVCAKLRALREPIACTDVCRIADELEQYTSQDDTKEVGE